MKRIFCILIVLVLIMLVNIPYDHCLVDIVASAFDDYSLSSEGECVVININNSNYEKLIDVLDLEIINKQYIYDRLIVEGYSHLIGESTCVKGYKCNVQLSIGDSSMIVGSPLIAGSF